MKKSNETALVRSCLDLLALKGILAWRNNSTGVFDPVRKVFRTFTGMKGVSDILGIAPKREAFPHGLFLAIEAKVKPRKPTPEQSEFLRMVNEAGGLGLLIYDVKDLHETLAGIGY